MKAQLFMTMTPHASYCWLRVELDGQVAVMLQQDAGISPRVPLPVHPLSLR